MASKVENPNEENPNGWTPLHAAASNGHTETVKYLAVRAENSNLCNPKNGRTPLNLAAKNHHTDVADVLLQQIVFKLKTNPTAFLNTLR